jgi:hypothetical protein
MNEPGAKRSVEPQTITDSEQKLKSQLRSEALAARRKEMAAFRERLKGLREKAFAAQGFANRSRRDS